MPAYTLFYDAGRGSRRMEESVEAKTVSEARAIAATRLSHAPEVSRILVFRRSIEVGAVWRRN